MRRAYAFKNVPQGFVLAEDYWMHGDPETAFVIGVHTPANKHFYVVPEYCADKHFEFLVKHTDAHITLAPVVRDRRNDAPSDRVNGLGRRGGDGPNTGKTATRYRVVLPDGSVTIKRTFDTNAEEAFAMVYLHGGEWKVSGVTDSPKAWGDQVPLLAHRTSERPPAKKKIDRPMADNNFNALVDEICGV